MSDFMQLLEDRDGWRDKYHDALREIDDMKHERVSILSELELTERSEEEYRKKYVDVLAAFGSEHRQYLIQQRSLEYFQLKCINLQRREDGLEPYNTTAEAAEAFIKETQADKKPEDLTLYGHKVIISNIPPVGHQLEHIVSPTAKQLQEAYERIIEEYGTGPAEPEEAPDWQPLGDTVTELEDVQGEIEIRLKPSTEYEAKVIAKLLGLHGLVQKTPKHPPRRKSKKTRKNHRKKKAMVTNGNF